MNLVRKRLIKELATDDQLFTTIMGALARRHFYFDESIKWDEPNPMAHMTQEESEEYNFIDETFDEYDIDYIIDSDDGITWTKRS